MKAILVNGANLRGVDRVPAEGTAGSVIWVSHGPVLEGDIEKLRQRKETVHAALIAQSSEAAAAKSLKMFRSTLASLNSCYRVFGLTKGWESLSDDTRRQIFDFLASDEKEPKDPELQKLLGTDLPVRRLALRFALELAQENLEPAEEIDRMLAPAATLVLEVETLKKELPASLINAFEGRLKPRGSEEWGILIKDALRQLQPATD